MKQVMPGIVKDLVGSLGQGGGRYHLRHLIMLNHTERLVAGLVAAPSVGYPGHGPSRDLILTGNPV